MKNLNIGMNSMELKSCVENLNQTKYINLLAQLRQQFQARVASKTSQEITLINDIDQYIGEYIDKILSPIIIEAIDENNKRIASDIQKLLSTK